MRRRGWITCALAIVSAGWTCVLAAQPVTGTLLEVRVRGVTVDSQAGSPVVLLEERQGERVLPIWVGVFEARAIAMEMDQVAPPRPMTHDLIKAIIEGVKAQVTQVAIVDLRDNTFYAQIALSTGASSLQIDARPSDAIALALRVKAPIYVAKTVLDRAPAIELHSDEPLAMTILKRHGLTLQNLTASLATHFQLPTADGVLVSDVEAGSAAERDGVRRGDVIVAANQGKIVNLQALESTLSQGGDVALQIVRGDKRLTVVLHSPTP
jgi:bifunctional DNase/RNase